MRIGEASRHSGCHIETIRYYEKQDLLPAPQRSANGYREYSAEQVERLRFITRGRELGFSLEEIRSLLKLAVDTALSCAEVDLLARAHLHEINQKIAQLGAMADELQRTITGCSGGDREHCAILQALSNSGNHAVPRKHRVDPHGHSIGSS